jgi:hypothetical protein
VDRESAAKPAANSPRERVAQQTSLKKRLLYQRCAILRTNAILEKGKALAVNAGVLPDSWSLVTLRNQYPYHGLSDRISSNDK